MSVRMQRTLSDLLDRKQAGATAAEGAALDRAFLTILLEKVGRAAVAGELSVFYQDSLELML